MSTEESSLNQDFKEIGHLDEKEQIMKKSELIFVPAPLMGHLVSIVEFAKNIKDQYKQLAVTVLVMENSSDDKVDSYSESLYADSSSGVRYRKITPEKSPSEEGSPGHFKLFEIIDSHKSQVRKKLEKISKSGTSEVAGVIVDMFCTSMIDVANEFGVPGYVFYPSGAAALGLALHLQSKRDSSSEDVASFLAKDTEVKPPTYEKPIPGKLLPGIVSDKNGGASEAFLDRAKWCREAKGIIINTFRDLESHAVEGLLKVEKISKVYTAGPILNQKGSSGENQEERKIFQWLDEQEDSSVVFLCFGSLGSFSKDQVMEIAHALEHSGHRFLWSLRKPPAERTASLPEGFLQHTEGIGMVIGWAPQMQVLAHLAVGGFVTHCGWNSILESIFCGVPMAAFPIYAEQQVNAFQMVKDLGLAVEITMDHRQDLWASTTDIVKAEVIENGIKLLMSLESEMLRNKVKEMKEKCRLALEEGGSASIALKCFINDIVKSNK